MFLCEPCHEKANCPRGFIEFMMPSHGACERCRKVGLCADCHGYNFSGLSEAEIQAKLDALSATKRETGR